MTAAASAISIGTLTGGALAPLLDRHDVENIHILGHDNGVLSLAGGERILAAPVADSEEEALKMITINAAIHLGIADKVGSIEAGKDADLAVFDRHPLSTYAVNQMTFVDGEMLFSREKDLAMREAMAAERAELEEKLSGEDDAGGGPGRRGPRRGPREGVRR